MLLRAEVKKMSQVQEHKEEIENVVQTDNRTNRKPKTELQLWQRIFLVYKN